MVTHSKSPLVMKMDSPYDLLLMVSGNICPGGLIIYDFLLVVSGNICPNSTAF